MHSVLAKIEPVIPNDTYINQQAHLAQIKAFDAWNYTKGSSEVVAAIIDAGVDIEHPDLKNNIWLNQNEIPGNSLDDDNNGYADDLYGWDFVENLPDPKPKTKTPYSAEALTHGTVVAGLIAAKGNNNEGVSGVAWNLKIMALRTLDSEGNGSLENAALAIRYAADNGADVINMSFVGANSKQEFADAIKYAYLKGVILVAAVGNDALGQQLVDGGDLDTRPLYPACHDGGKYHNYIIGVGAVNKADLKEDFSNYGNSCIDIMAPGSLIVSTQFVPEQPLIESLDALYGGYWAGTSFAAPQVSATAALMKSLNNDLNNNQLTAILLATADKIDDKNPGYSGLLGQGRLNVYRALKAIQPISQQPNSQAASPSSSAGKQPDSLKSLELYSSIWNFSEIKSQSLADEYMSVVIKFKNKGQKTWQKGEVVLSVYDKQGNITVFAHPEWKYKQGKIKFLNKSVALNEIAEFSFLIKAPPVAHKYNLVFTLEKTNQEVVKGGKVYKEIVVK